MTILFIHEFNTIFWGLHYYAKISLCLFLFINNLKKVFNKDFNDIFFKKSFRNLEIFAGYVGYCLDAVRLTQFLTELSMKVLCSLKFCYYDRTISIVLLWQKCILPHEKLFRVIQQGAYYKLLILEINMVYLACLNFHRAIIVFKNFGEKKVYILFKDFIYYIIDFFFMKKKTKHIL